MPKPDHPLITFRGAYGRMCVLIAYALTNDYHERSVMEASRGKGRSIGLVYRRLRAQRIKLNDAYSRARDAGIPLEDLTNVARAMRETVQEEWMCEIPLNRARRRA